MTISLCMIVKNEAANLPQCLNSVAGLVDEIIVVDTGSTDDTRKMAADRQAEVLSIDWPEDFSVARNVSLSQATGDWVLVLDADEVLDAGVGRQLKRLDRGDPPWEVDPADLIAINLLRQEIGAAQAPYTLITRFFRRLPEIQFARPYHETVDDSIACLQHKQPHWQVLTLDQVGIYHTGYDPAVVVERGKFSRAQALMEDYLERHPEDPSILNKLAALYLEQDNTEAALPLLNRALARTKSLDPITRYELHYHRALAHRYDYPDRAAMDYGEALQQNLPPRLKLGALINLGNLKKAEGNLSEALALFQQAVDADPSLAIAHYNLGVTQRLRGYLDDAIAAYRQAIALAPNYAEAYQNLAVALFKLGKLPEALQNFGRAAQLYEVANPAQAESLKQKVKALNIPSTLLAQSYFA